MLWITLRYRHERVPSHAGSHECHKLQLLGIGEGPSNLLDSKEAPKVLFLMETKCDLRKIEEVRRKLGFVGTFTVDCIGRSSGLCLFWDEDVDLTIRSYTAHHIDALITLHGSDQIWRFTGVLFNLDDKIGGSPVDVGRFWTFAQRLRDVGFVNWKLLVLGSPRTMAEKGRECIDLVFINDKWLERFLNAKADHLDQCGSDHVPVKVVLNGDDVEEPSLTPRQYRFEAMWVDDESCLDIVRNAWMNPGSSQADRSVMGKVARCVVDLKDWDFSVFGNVNRELRMVREELRMMGMSGSQIGHRRELEARERKLMRREEAMWLQRAKVNEFKWGDQNTSFFHKKALGRKKRNTVKKLVEENGLEWCSFDGKAKVALDYFQSLFASSAVRDFDVAAQERVIDLIDWECGSWDVEKVRETFVPCDANLILKMKLTDPSKADELVWFHSNDDLFTVGSAYQMLLQKEIAEESEGASSSSNDSELLWNKLWRLNVPLRVRSFIWRGCRNILPTKVNLCRRGITPDDRCEFCGRLETDIHVRDSPSLLKLGLRVNSMWNCAANVNCLMSMELEFWALMCRNI
ncbi:hypothetical protein V2J09_012916 [Rumex salicifolius]